MNLFFDTLKGFSDENPLTSISMNDLGYTRSPEANAFIFNDSFAFVCGLIFDQSIKSELAWAAPLELKKRLSGLSPSILITFTEEQLNEIIATKPALHRYPQAMAQNLLKTSRIVLDKYDGKAELLWMQSKSSKAIKKRFLELTGIGEKKANLALVMLMRDFNQSFEDTDGIGLALDVHLNRILKRSGHFDITTTEGVEQTNSNFETYFGQSYQAIGTYLWIIGRTYCHESEPNCLLCPLNQGCQKVLNA